MLTTFAQSLYLFNLLFFLIDNVGGIAEMACTSHRIRERTTAHELPTTLPPLERDLLLSAALVSLALCGAFVSCAGVKTVDVSTPKIFMGLNVGAILVFSHDHEECGQCRLENGGRS
ncbi:putative inorganic diphosphatase [Helianthus annuus]|nr:putative inorganic diphosphatase [Helianthus annuus]KAJ0737781.1 putative inorganic diphosphatase [Helianthus annuus]KAJ0740656.1 putative inorganic diphosphatase [Helianthus annuus]KAJ0915258.1 putative inorganic diphosphatase [Helianthus annuus]